MLNLNLIFYLKCDTPVDNFFALFFESGRIETEEIRMIIIKNVWKDIWDSIIGPIKDVFCEASKGPPPCMV